MKLNQRFSGCPCPGLVSVLTLCFVLFGLPVKAGIPEYQAALQAKVYAWSQRNRINQGVLHRDKHSDCILMVVVATEVQSDGTLLDASVAASSGVPVVDKYFVYATQNAARTFPPLEDYFSGSVPLKIRMDIPYVLDTRDEQGSRAQGSMKYCKPLAPPERA